MFWLIRILYDGGTLLAPALLVGAALLQRADHRRAGFALAVAALLVVVRIYATHVEPRRLEVREAEVTTRSAGAGSEPLRIIHLSDIQSDAIGAWEQRVMAEVAALGPDLVIHTGDLLHPIEPATVRSELPKIEAALAQIHAPKLTVEGDTDGWFVGLEDQEQVAGMELLVDRATTLEIRGRRVAVLGLSLLQSAGGARDAIVAWLATVPPDAITIVAGHRPDFALELAGLDIDLVLAGHTHGGQIRLPWLGPIITLSRVPREWARGFRTIHDGIALDVSAGIGAEHAAGLPSIRVLCPPELTVLTVR
ncbi:MAG: metallophosphoesterase [Polyangiaceae bacterium]